MSLECGCPLTAHRKDCILAPSGGGITTGTYDLPACSRCGDVVYALVGTVCLKCLQSDDEAAEVADKPINFNFTLKTSWVCGRCDVSNAPHMDQCGCVP